MHSTRLPRLISLPLTAALASAFLLAFGMAPPARAAAGLTLTTPFPGVTASPDSRVSFDLEVDATEAGRINLAMTGVPASWSASLHGGGLVVTSVLLDGDDPVEVRLDIDVPADATGTTTIVVVASDAESRVELPISILVAANAGGEVVVDADLTDLRGSSDQTFTFNLNVANDTEQDLTYSASGQAPPGWTVEVELTGQTQAVNATVEAGGTAGVTARVTPAANADAGTYPIPVSVTVGADQYPVDLNVEITGNYSVALDTPNDLLSGRGPSGSVTEQTFTITNTGTAPLTGVTMSATSPTNWDVEFDPPTTASIPPEGFVTIKALITPSGNAIAGDYSLTFRVNAEEADDDATFRFTVETSIIGGLIGVAVIVAAVGGLMWVFRKYGRR